jgi:hypothetical protein
MRNEYQSINFADGSRAVLFDWMDGRSQDRNLVCVDPHGNVRWIAELPTTDPIDCFVDIRQDGELLLANSTSCYAVWIEPNTGQILKIQFTK